MSGKSVAAIAMIVASSLAVFSCAKAKPKTSSTVGLSGILSLTGTAQVPVVLAPLAIFAGGLSPGYSFTWSACPGTGNQSAAAATLVLETQTNCSVSQYIHIDNTTAQDLSDYAAGSLTFGIEVNTAGQSLAVLLQDSASHASTAVNLSSYGFNPATTGVVQAITVPMSLLATNSVDLTQITRVFELTATCPGNICLTTMSNIKFTAVAASTATGTATGTSTTTVTNTNTATSTVTAELALANPGPIKRGPVCSHYKCRPVASRPVGIIKPSKTGWQKIVQYAGVTSATGAITLNTNWETVLEATSDGSQAYIAISIDDNGSLTLLSPIPADALTFTNDVAEFELDIDITTTVTSLAQCSSGTYPDSTCTSDPNESLYMDDVEQAIDAYLDQNPPDTSDLPTLIQDVLNNPAVEQIINADLAKIGAPPIDATTVAAAPAQTPVPTIVFPTTTPSTSPSTTPGTGGTNSGFPANLPTGNWQIAISICVTDAPCTTEPPQTATDLDPAALQQQLQSAMQTACAQASNQGVSCSMTYSAFNGSQFTATFNFQSCSGGQCASGTETMTVTKE